MFRSRRASGRVAGLLAFCVPFAILLATNHLRFGSPVEFGYSLGLTGLPASDLAVRFSYPYALEPFGRASLELGSALFLESALNGRDFLRGHFFPFQSPTPRLREFYFSSFGPIALVLLLASWGGVALEAVRRRTQSPPEGWTRTRNGLAAAGALSFLFPFLFYLRAPSIISRYLIDFLPAVAVAWLGGILVLMERLCTGTRDRRLLFLSPTIVIAAALGLFVHTMTTLRIKADEYHTVVLTREALSHLRRPPAPGIPRLPETYECRAAADQIAGIPSNLSGWRWKDDCSVGVATAVFFANADCIELEFAASRTSPGLEPGHLGLKVGLDRFELRMYTPPSTSRRGQATFCRRAGRRPSSRPPGGIELVTVKWVDELRTLSDAPAIRLLSIRKGRAGLQ